MKTLAKTLFAAVLAVVLLASSSVKGLAANTTQLELPATGFNKIWVSGNVKVFLTQSDKEGVFVDEDFNPAFTSVMGKGNTLYINTTEIGCVVIRVSVKDLQRIEAAGNAQVITSNKFDVKCLQVILSQSASAKVNAIAGSLYTNVREDARLKMSGVTDQHTAVATNAKNVQLDGLLSLSTKRPQADMELGLIAAQLTAIK